MAESFKHDISAADFRLFLALWNQRQGLGTPDIHFRMAGWLEHCWKSGDKRLLLMAFRSCGKSTLVGVFAAWLLYITPELRILVLAADDALARKMVRNVKRILERHPLTTHLIPDKPDQWGSDRFTVKRMLELRDPSMMARGITSNITGSRADLIICDDVEVPNTCDSAEKREDLRERLAETSYILSPGGTQIYVGTPHHYYSIYAEKPRVEIAEERVFLESYKRLKLPILANNGQSVWPERYSERDIERIKMATGPNKFASQMMLEPVNIADGRLNPDLLNSYSDEIDYAPELQTLFLGQRKLATVTAYWDPAFGSAQAGTKRDNSVLAIVYGDLDGNYFIHHVEYIKIDLSVSQDEATAQSEIVAELARNFRLPSLVVENNGLGKFLPNILRNVMAKNNVPTKVIEQAQSRNKEERIIEAYDAVMAAKRLYIFDGVKKTPFLTEMREWRPGRSKGHDDGLDAVAGALAMHPDRSKRLYGKGEHNWMRTGNPVHAKTDYEV